MVVWSVLAKIERTRQASAAYQLWRIALSITLARQQNADMVDVCIIAALAWRSAIMCRRAWHRKINGQYPAAASAGVGWQHRRAAARDRWAVR